MERQHELGHGSGTAPAEPRTFDGVICFGGEDWWYHNRGHYDMQMMRELSAFVPVLYVNSIGMRVPSLGKHGMFLRRVARKLRSLRQGLTQVRPGLSVFSPLAVPGRRGAAVNRRILPMQVRRAAARLSIRRPLVWVACPPGAAAVDRLDPVGVVYQRTDRYECFRGVDTDLIRGYDGYLKERADLTLFCSQLLYGEESAACRASAFIDHGVDFERFALAGVAGSKQDPSDTRTIPRPRVGFIGGIDSHTFDPALFLDVARRLEHVQFLLVGGCSLPNGWCVLPNVKLFGQRPYDEVAAYMAACDVLIMPWNQSEWIRACNPVKLKEYLAVGRPVVSTPFDELCKYGDFVQVASGADAFVDAVRTALAGVHDAAPGRRRVERETWAAKGGVVLAELRAKGLVPHVVGANNVKEQPRGVS